MNQIHPRTKMLHPLCLIAILAMIATGSLVPVNAQAPTPTVAVSAVQNVLLSPATPCSTACIWSLLPGKQTVADVLSLLQTTFGAAPSTYSDTANALLSYYAAGVSLNVHTSASPTVTTLIDYYYVSVDVTEAKGAGITIDSFAPAAVVQIFGAPSDAFLIAGGAKSGRFRLILYFAARSEVYILRSVFKAGKACLSITGAETLTLYQFPNSASAEMFIRETTGNGTTLPSSITTTTKQTLKDFSLMAQSPDSKCLNRP